MSSLFKLRGKLDRRTRIILEIAGFLLVLLIWFLITYAKKMPVEQNLLQAEEMAYISSQQGWLKSDTLSEKAFDWLLEKRGDDDRTEGFLNSDEIRYLFNIRSSYSIKPAVLNQEEMDLIGYRRSNPIVNPGLIPKPMQVLKAFPELFSKNDLVRNTCRSIGLNLAGYLEAIFIAIPLGFLIGLIPLFRGSFQKLVDAFRYVPLTAVTGLFVLWFGINTSMQAHFLAFGILIYLLPVVVQRIDEVKEVYLKTVHTLGATDWQTFKTVYFPSVMSRLSDDIRVLTAISWTYIIVAESLGSKGGLGSMIWRIGQRLGKVDKMFALLIIIIIIGLIQDRLFVYLDKKFFPFKYQGDGNKYGVQKENEVFKAILNYVGKILIWAFIAVYLMFAINEFTSWFSIDDKPFMSYYFGETVWTIHFVALSVIAFTVYKFVKK